MKPKQKVLAVVLSGMDRHFWIHPDLAMMFVRMARDERFTTEFATILDCRPFETARNIGLATARSENADWCIMFDNDGCPATSPLDIVAGAPSDASLIGVRAGITMGRNKLGHYPAERPEHEYEEVEQVGGAVLMINSRVWQTIKRGPWFKWEFVEGSETRQTACGEDWYFSRLLRKHGMKVYVHSGKVAHYHQQDLSAIASMIEPKPFNVADLITVRPGVQL